MLHTLGLDTIPYRFRLKPLLIGGKAMEHYDLRRAGDDIDFVVSAEDYSALANLYPDQPINYSTD